MRQTLWLVPAWLIMVYAGVFLHELGHAIAGRRNGYEVGGIGFGVGRPRLVVNLGGLRLYVGRQRLGVGLALAVFPTFFAPRERQIGMLRGGIIANLITTVLATLCGLLFPPVRVVCLLFAGVNALLAITAAVPKQLNLVGLQSDGGQIRGLRRGYFTVPLPGSTLEYAKPMVELLEGLKFHSYLFVAQLAVAGAWTQLGQADRAEAALACAKNLPLKPNPARETYLRMMEAYYLAENGHSEQALAGLDGAEADFRAQGNTRGILVVILNRAQVLLMRGEAGKALAIVEGLEPDPLFKEFPFAAAYTAAYRLRAAILLDDREQVDRRLAAYQEVRKQSLSAVYDSQIYTLLAVYMAERGRDGAAAIADRALAAFGAVYRTCPDAESKASYIAKETPRLLELAAVYQRLGQEGRLADIEAHFAALDAAQKQADEAARVKQARAVRHSVAAYAAAVVVTAAALALGLTAILRGPPASHEEEALGMMGIMAIGVGVLNLLLAILLRFTAQGRAIGGWAALAFSLVPWLVWLFLRLLL